MRFLVLACLVVVAVCACVYGKLPDGYRRPHDQHKRRSVRSTGGIPRPRPGGTNQNIARNRTRTLQDKARSLDLSESGSSKSNDEMKCNFKTDNNCARCVMPAYAGEGVKIEFIRDGRVDCTDGSDEKPRKCDPRTDDPDCFDCHSGEEGEGVFWEFTCDHIEDCSDGSDERCSRECNADENWGCFRCFRPEIQGEGTFEDFLCDNKRDCSDGSDEFCFDCDFRGYRDCSETQDCGHDSNIDQVCNGRKDCKNNEDEFDCFQCQHGIFKIDPDWKCDDYDDCNDNSDEQLSMCLESQGPSENQGDCSWEGWSDWSDCSADCGAGKQSRTRRCSCESDGCVGDSTEVKGCHGDKTCPPEASGGCGTRSTPQGRIVGGENAMQSSWPWQAQLLYKGSFLCGGTLYKNKYVISAAHCFMPGREDAKDWTVHLGQQDTYGSAKYESGVSQIIFNDYNRYTFDNDIVVMVLSNPITTTIKDVNGICLDQGKNKRFNSLSNCYITGFGLTEDNGNVANTLQEVSVPYIRQRDCVKTQYGYTISSNMFCAGYTDMGGIDACQGDSGGPLVCTAKDDNDRSLTRWYLAGVTSWGNGCAKKNLPGVYADVSKYIDWLVTVTL